LYTTNCEFAGIATRGDGAKQKARPKARFFAYTEVKL
jgi:hypothetical protein